VTRPGPRCNKVEGEYDRSARPSGRQPHGLYAFRVRYRAKWLDLRKQIAPDLKRAALLRDCANPAASAQFGAIQAAGSSQAVEARPINVGDAGEIELVGAYCGRILNGAQPAEPPVVQASTFEFVINTHTCRGAERHRAADEVIE
jgi:hypothetical protein